jgi:hypothetical protein
MRSEERKVDRCCEWVLARGLRVSITSRYSTPVSVQNHGTRYYTYSWHLKTTLEVPLGVMEGEREVPFGGLLMICLLLIRSCQCKTKPFYAK